MPSEMLRAPKFPQRLKSDEIVDDSSEVSKNDDKKNKPHRGLMSHIIIRRPNRQELQLDTSDLSANQSDGSEDALVGASDNMTGQKSGQKISSSKRKRARSMEKLEITLDEKQVLKERLSVYFIVDNLIAKQPKKDAHTAIKKERIEKWYRMVTYGLDDDIAHKVFKPNEVTTS